MKITKTIFLVGIVLCCFLFFGPEKVFAQFGLGGAQTVLEPSFESLSAANGRFVFGQISDSSKDQFMLDTLTGRLWRIAESGEIGIYLRSVPYRTSADEYTPLPEKLSDSKDEEGKEK